MTYPPKRQRRHNPEAEVVVSEAPVEVWVRPGPTWESYYTTAFPEQGDAVRYVRSDLYDKRLVENVTEAGFPAPEAGNTK